MAKSRKVRVVDGYDLIKAVKQAAQDRRQPVTDEAPAPPAAGAPAGPSPPLRNPARTVMPTKRIIECYECAYRFPLTGRAAQTHCPKCRVPLDLTDHIVDRHWSGILKTAGMVRIYPNGVVGDGFIVANDVVLEGVVDTGHLRAMRRLKLQRGGKFNEAQTQYRDLVVGEGVQLVLAQPTKVQDVEITGHLTADLQVTGILTIKPGGLFQGKVRGQHLIVEEGGGLIAAVMIEPK
jgi:cytoskeletal protein CcmA (bactofilin family)